MIILKGYPSGIRHKKEREKENTLTRRMLVFHVNRYRIGLHRVEFDFSRLSNEWVITFCLLFFFLLLQQPQQRVINQNQAERRGERETSLLLLLKHQSFTESTLVAGCAQQVSRLASMLQAFRQSASEVSAERTNAPLTLCVCVCIECCSSCLSSLLFLFASLSLSSACRSHSRAS